MFREQLLQAMNTKYGDTFKIGDPMEYVAQFPTKHKKVGRLRVYEEEMEVTFEIEHIAHDHIYFTENDGKIKSDRQIIRESMGFLDELFTDKLLLGLQKDLIGTVIVPLFVTKDPEAHMEPEYDYYLWSGPLHNPTEVGKDTGN